MGGEIGGFSGIGHQVKEFEFGAIGSPDDFPITLALSNQAS